MPVISFYCLRTRDYNIPVIPLYCLRAREYNMPVISLYCLRDRVHNIHVISMFCLRARDYNIPIPEDGPALHKYNQIPADKEYSKGTASAISCDLQFENDNVWLTTLPLYWTHYLNDNAEGIVVFLWLTIFNIVNVNVLCCRDKPVRLFCDNPFRSFIKSIKKCQHVCFHNLFNSYDRPIV